MNIIDNLNWRYAVKKFNTKKVPDKDIQTLKEAIKLSPSSYGLQPYRVIAISSEDIKRELLPYSCGQDKVVHCSHLFVFAAEKSSPDVIVDRYIDAYAKANSVAPNMLLDMSKQMKGALTGKDTLEIQQWAHQQVFIALGNFLTCAANLKIDTCPMGGFESNGYDKVLALKNENLTTSVICPVGYRHHEDRNAYKPKVRLDDNFLFEER